MSSAEHEVRYEADEQPPLPLTIGLGIQYAVVALGSVVLTPAILISVAGQSEAYLNWAVFAALVVSGLVTVVQSVRLGRIGAGYILIMGSTTAFLPMSVTALAQGGPALLATLIVMSSLVQFVLGAKMALLRRVFTPTVAGTVLMLIPVSLAPIVFKKMEDVPAGASESAASVTALVTLATIVLVALRLSGAWRVWAPAIGLVVGGVTGLAFGIYDVERVAAAPWFGLPHFSAYPGLDLTFGSAFWALLPGFLIVTLVGAMDTLGDAIAIQRASWRRARAIDFRAIQGAINADGLGNLLSGIGGTVPNTTYGSGIAISELTGITARSVGVCAGILFVVLALMPKLVALIVAMPGPVAGAYLAVIIALLFVFGVKILTADGLDYRKSLIVGFALLGGPRVPVRLGVPAVLDRCLGGTARAWDDRGRHHRDPPLRLSRPDRSAAKAPAHRPFRVFPCRNRRLPVPLREQGTVRRNHDLPFACRCRGDLAYPPRQQCLRPGARAFARRESRRQGG